MKIRIQYILMLIGVMFLLTGCWDNVELNDRHVVLEIAIDKADEVMDGEGLKNSYKITYTIPDAGKLSGQESLAEDVKTTMVTMSPTIVTSINDMEAKLQNTLTFSHVKAIVFGKEILEDRELFKNAIDSFARNVEFSRGVNILVSKGKASDITQSDNYQNLILGLCIMKYFNNTAKETGYAKQQSLGNMLKEIQNTGVTMLPIISNVEEEKTVEIGGAAVIQDYELMGWIDKDTMRGVMLANGNTEEMPLVIENQGDYLTYTIKNIESSINYAEDGSIVVDILVDGDITEGLSAMNNKIFYKDDIERFTRLIEEKIGEKVKQGINKEKEMGVDFLGIGIKLYRKYPKKWKVNKGILSKEEIQKLNLITHVRADISNTGIIE